MSYSSFSAGRVDDVAEQKGKDCYEIFLAFVPTEWEPLLGAKDKAKSWKVGTSLVMSVIAGFLGKPKVDGHIIKMCKCLSWLETQALAVILRKNGIDMDVGKWDGLDAPIYSYASLKLNCKDHSGGFLGMGVTKKCGTGSKCNCADYTSVDLRGLTEKTKKYTASDGSKITVGPSTDFKTVIAKIVEYERRVMPLDCANGDDPDAIIVRSPGGKR